MPCLFNISNHQKPKLVLVLSFVMLCLAGCAATIQDKAADLSRAGHYDEAVKTLEDGIKQHPDDIALRANLTKLHVEAFDQLLAEVNKQRTAGNLDEAEKTLKRAAVYDDGNHRVASLLQDINIERNQNEALKHAETLTASHQETSALHIVGEALKDNPHHAGLLALQRRLEMLARQSEVQTTQLGLQETRPISLDFREANLRNVLDVVSRNSGVNFILDKDIRPDIKVTTYLKSVHVEDAIDLITSTNLLTKKVLDEKTILIYPNTPEKQREYQEQVVKVFYLSNGNAQGAASFLKSMLKLHDPFVDERRNMLSLRESPETIGLAERLVTLYDSSDAEVLLEVEVLEVDATRLTNLGVKLPSTFSLTPLPQSGESGLTLSSLLHLNSGRIGVSTPGVTFNLQKQVGDINILANPSIRARNHEKAKILIGEKVPTIAATVGLNGFVTDSVTYQDVGLKLQIEPNIFPDDEVAIKVALEVSSLGTQTQTSNGTTAYQINTREVSTDLSLHDGETQLLAGLINRQNSTSSSRVPGLGDFPVLGRIFRSQTDDSSRSELVLSITPHVLRNVRHPDVTETELWVGTETNQRIRASGGRPVTNLAVQGVGQLALQAQQGTAESIKGQPAMPVQVKAEDVSVAKATDSANPEAAGKLIWVSPQEVRAGDTFELLLQAQGAKGVRTLPINLHYVENLFQVVAVEQGESSGTTSGFSRQIDTQAGVIRMNTLYPAGLNGNASIAKIKLKALQAGIAEFFFVSNGASADESLTVSGMALPETLKLIVKQ